jgi:uncharacterized protein
MASDFEKFFERDGFVVIGHSARAPFPKLSFGALLAKGKRVFAVDPSVEEVEGQRAYPDLASLPDGNLTSAIIEVPKDETRDWIARVADAGIEHVWIHMGRETPEALELAKERGLKVCYGTCAVQYLDKSFPHSIHGFIRKVLGRY